MNASKQHGFSLVELMISMALGTVLIGGTLTVYIATVTSSTSTLKMSKLNQELTTLMSVMVQDIRRAGFGANNAATDPTANPFNDMAATALVVVDDIASDTVQGTQGSGTCILYAYDTNLDGNLTTVNDDEADIAGFRLSSGVVQMREGDPTKATHNTSCVASGNEQWLDVTDDSVISIDTLTFDLANSACVNTREDNGIDEDLPLDGDTGNETNCYTYATGVGDITVETRDVAITVTGSLVSDSDVTLTLSQNVRVRNDLVRTR